MKRFIQRIKVFWVLYLILFPLVFIVFSLFALYGMKNQELAISLILIMALVLIVLSILSLALPDNNIIFRCLLRLARRIRIFWGMYAMYIFVFVIAALADANQNIYMIISIILAVITILSIILPEDNGFFKVLLFIAKHSISMVVDFVYAHGSFLKIKNLYVWSAEASTTELMRVANVINAEVNYIGISIILN